MSEMSTLTELARFIGQSRASAELAEARVAISSLARDPGRLQPRRRVAEILAAVLVLSARARRMIMPPAGVEIDVFTPGGVRAVRVTLPRLEPEAS